MRESDPTTQAAVLGWLNTVVNEDPNPKREVELWKVKNGERELTCIAVYLPSGIDVRLMEQEQFAARSSYGMRRHASSYRTDGKQLW